jgi:type II secretory pathway component PulJ
MGVSNGASTMTKRNIQRSRHGHSLIELMVVFSVFSATMILTGMVFFRLFQSEQTATRTTLIQLTISRLADQFRRDVHAAEVVQWKEMNGATQLELTSGSPKFRVSYTANSNSLQREVVSESNPHHESYRLPECQLAFPHGEVDQSDRSIRLVVLKPRATVTKDPQSISPLRKLVIEAELGRDHRLITGIESPLGESREVQP